MMQIVYGLAGAVTMSVFYLVVYKLRAIEAWAKREEGPRERVGFFLALMATMGFVAGAMAYAPIQAGIVCQQSGKPIVACMLMGEAKK